MHEPLEFDYEGRCEEVAPSLRTANQDVLYCRDKTSISLNTILTVAGVAFVVLLIVVGATGGFKNLGDGP